MSSIAATIPRLRANSGASNDVDRTSSSQAGRDSSAQIYALGSWSAATKYSVSITSAPGDAATSSISWRTHCLVGGVEQQRHDQDKAPHGGFVGGPDQVREICHSRAGPFLSNNNCESDQRGTMANRHGDRGPNCPKGQGTDVHAPDRQSAAGDAGWSCGRRRSESWSLLSSFHCYASPISLGTLFGAEIALHDEAQLLNKSLERCRFFTNIEVTFVCGPAMIYVRP